MAVELAIRLLDNLSNGQIKRTTTCPGSKGRQNADRQVQCYDVEHMSDWDGVQDTFLRKGTSPDQCILPATSHPQNVSLTVSCSEQKYPAQWLLILNVLYSKI